MGALDFTRCLACGGRLDRAAFFCHPCEAAFCSTECLTRHRKQAHAPPWAGPLSSSATAGLSSGGPNVVKSSVPTRPGSRH
jgi:hypothetical protein